jgi:LmeA-like phospholipid-binding
VATLARVAILALVIALVFLLLRDCAPSRVVFPSPSPTVSASIASPTRSVTPRPSASGTATIALPATFTLTVTDAQLTKAAASSFPQTVSGVTVRDPVVRTTTRDVQLTASARLFFGTTEFVMTGTPYASAGRVAVRVDSVTLGGFGLPDSVRASAAASVESAIGQLVPSTVTVQKVTLGEGTVTIEGVTGR